MFCFVGSVSKGNVLKNGEVRHPSGQPEPLHKELSMQDETAFFCPEDWSTVEAQLGKMGDSDVQKTGAWFGSHTRR